MRTRLLFLAGWMFIPFLQLSAQLDNFDLSTYKLPEIKRKQLDFNFSTQLNQTIQATQDRKLLDVNGNFSLGLSTYTNLKDYQGSSSVQIGMSPYYSGSSLKNNYDNISKSFSDGLSFNFINRYFMAEQFFIEADINGNLNNLTTNNINKSLDAGNNLTSKNTDDQANSNILAQATLLFGKGRIEPVQDARLAVYILDDLQKLNKLSRTPSNDEILEFSALISQLMNQRYFDYRLHKIEELKAVDAFLREKGLLKDEDITSFSSINDNWDYSDGPQRLTGSKFYFGVSPTIGFDFNLDHQYSFDANLIQTYYYKSQNNDRNLGLNGLAGFEYNKPIKLRWQVQAGISANYGVEYEQLKNVTANTTDKVKMSQIYPSEYAGLGYYPNSRTSVSATLGFNQRLLTNYDYNTVGNSWDKTSQINYYTESLAVNFTYYVSPQLRLNGNWQLSPQQVRNITSSTKNNNLNQSFNLALTYAIF